MSTNDPQIPITSLPASSSRSAGKWLANAKRFNAQRIRRRMKEQQERYGSKENGDQEVSTGMNDALTTPPLQQPAARAIPPLTISVTVSEDGEEPIMSNGDMLVGEHHRQLGLESDESTTANNVSVWAMMEHYQVSKDDASRVTGGPENSNEVEQTSNASIWGPSSIMDSYSFQSSELFAEKIPERNSVAHAKAIFVQPTIRAEEHSHRTSECVSSASKIQNTPNRIVWQADDNGELVERSFCTQGSTNEPGLEIDLHLDQSMDTQARKAIARSRKMRDNFEEKENYVGVRGANNITDDPYFLKLLPFSTQTQPIPARVECEWQESKTMQEDTSPPGSLLKESIIQSECHHQSTVSTGYKWSDHGRRKSLESIEDLPDESSAVDSSAYLENATQLSLLSLQPSEYCLSEGTAHSESINRTSVISPHSFAMPGTVAKNQKAAGEENFANLARIQELEQNLKERQHGAAQVNSTLKERVTELEQALKAAATTPRGTIGQNPLKTLLDRNQTLVKEVRFADQTCVELSSKVSALQAQNEILNDQLTSFEAENDDLRLTLKARETIEVQGDEDRDGTITRLSEELKGAEKKIERLKSVSDDGIIPRGVIDELKREFEALGQVTHSLHASSGSTIISEVDGSTVAVIPDTRALNISHASHWLRLLLQGLHGARLQNKALVEKLESSKIQERGEFNDSNLLDSKDTMLQEIEGAHNENDLLGRQLGNVQDKLDETRHELQRELSRSTMLEQRRKRETEAHLAKIKSLEHQIQQAVQRMPLTSPTFPPLLGSDKQMLVLEKERVDAKSIALKLESDKTIRSIPSGKIHEQKDAEFVEIMHGAMSRMHEKYNKLDEEVQDVVQSNSERLESLAKTVFYLRNSLLFESESVSTHVQEEAAQGDMDASIDFQQDTNDEDQMLELMEEARSPPSADTTECEVSSDFGDISRLFTDDATLESLVKGSSIGSLSDMERWKEPLEAAIRECQKVRQRSSKLKGESESKAVALESLELENGRLSLEVSRKNEELRLVEKALEEAKSKIQELDSSLHDSQEARDAALYTQQEMETSVRNFATEKLDLQYLLRDVQSQKEALEERLQAVAESLTSSERQLQASVVSSDGCRKQWDDSILQMEARNAAISEKTDKEIGFLRNALEQANSDLENLQRSHHETLAKLTYESEKKSNLEAELTDLQLSQQQMLLDTEDHVLEYQCGQEDMRKEKAELKAKLSRKEKEITCLKEAIASYKNRIQEQLDQKDSLINSLESDMSELLGQSESLKHARRQFCGVLESLGLNVDEFHPLSTISDESCLESRIAKCSKEFSFSRAMMPVMVTTIQSLFESQRKADQLEKETCRLQEDLSQNHELEIDHKKQVEEGKIQNAKLFALLRQAELEMERSAKQIREMSAALSKLQQQESEATEKADRLEVESVTVQREAARLEQETSKERRKSFLELSEIRTSMENKDSKLSEVSGNLLSTQSELETKSEILRSKEKEENRLRTAIAALETKCSRLRLYVKKLTVKCEEWEISYEKQSRLSEKLHGKNNKIRERASEVATRYRKLLGDVERKKKLHYKDREKWTVEKSNLHQVHAQLEEELEMIAEELAIVDRGPA